MNTKELTDSQTPTDVEKLRGLPWGVAWSMTNSVFAQLTFFGSIFVLYLDELGLDKAQIGGLLSLLPFFGIIAVFIAAPVARLGYKRVFVSSFAVRTASAVLLLLTPVILLQFGQDAILAYILATVAVFGLFRAIGFTAFFPWLQEQVPDAMRGKFTALKNTLSNLTVFLAVLAAGYVLGPDPALSQFMILIAVGVVVGIISVWTSTRIPGGAPIRSDPAAHSSSREMIEAGRDRNFVSYLVGAGLVTLSTVPLVSFVSLFMNEQVGLTSNQVVWLQNGRLLGGLASGFLWGWLADRYGSKPVMLSAVYMLPLLPLAWLLMPRQVPASLYVALAIALVQGVVNSGWGIGAGRLLFVRVVPGEKKSAYMALYYASLGVAGGLGQLFGGWLVDVGAGLQGQWGIMKIDSYTLLFLVGITLPLISLLLFRRVKADSAVTVRQFASMFFRGNPFLALESLIRYRRARDERAAVAMTERMGSTRSPLTDEELLEALHDPRFFVRFEAIVSIARHNPDPRLTDALIETLEGNDPSLSTIAAWGLGRIGDERALEALRRGLGARYRSVQAHCARSLGSLGDRTVIPILLDRLMTEEDVGLRMAFASTLGKLDALEAAEPLLALLRTSGSGDARTELTLALARLIGEEHYFIQLQRRAESEPGTTLSQAVTALQDKLAKSQQSSLEVEEALEVAAEVLAHDDLPRGVERFCDALRLLPLDRMDGTCGIVIRECVAQMEAFGPQRLEYVILALHASDCGLSE